MKNLEQSAKNFQTKSKTSKERNIVAKKSIVTFTTNSKATVKLTQISVTDAQLTKYDITIWRLLASIHDQEIPTKKADH